MEEYELGVKPGYYIVFDHKEFKGEPGLVRWGTEKDSQDIRTTFKGLRFDGHAIIRDATKQHIFDKLSQVFSSNLLDDYGSVFVFILTHGGKGYNLQAYDTDYQFTRLFEEAMECASDSLRDKPKVFIIQACNGGERDHGTCVVRTPSSDNYSPHPFLLPALPNVLLAFSSAPGYVSYRNYFIPLLCQSIVEHGDQYDLKTLLTLGRRELADLTFTENGQDRCKQIPVLISTLTKKLRLKSSATTSIH